MVKCPICEQNVDIKNINKHLDDCEIRYKRMKREKESQPPSSPSLKGDSLLESEQTREPDSESTKEDLTPLVELTSGKSKNNLSQLLTGNKKKDRPRTYKWVPPSQRVDDDPPPHKGAETGESIKRENDGSDSFSPPKKRKMNPIDHLKLTYHLPLSERLRPVDLTTYIGQSHLVGPRGILRGYLNQGKIPSLILWGSPGTGKTTLARILGQSSHSRVVEMSGVMHGVSDCKKVFEEAQNEMKLTRKPTIVFVDEIHRFSKNQQDVFLGYVERGIIVLIGATTENPSFTLNKALLSRCRVFVLERMTDDEIREIITRGFTEVNKVRRLILHSKFLKVTPKAIDWVASVADGDNRLALGCVELIDSHFSTDEGEDGVTTVEVDQVKEILKKSTVLYDRVGDAHYDTISAFHKSVRGSNPDAAMYYLARMLKGGEDPLYIARRMIRIASEDVGVLDDSCLPFAVAAYQAVQFVGLPEADLALVHCAVKLARAPKSVEIYKGWKEMRAWMDEPHVEGAEIPLHLRNAPTTLMSKLGYSKNYKYNPEYKDGKVKQDYFPETCGEKKVLRGEHTGDLIDFDLQD
ncbi:ssDNA-dependent ATPase [Martiniozyma asiatica (nom. inval.)]|nr:ssDNA-dependent ATPase [Martiniozyma asiatica]